MKRNLDLSRWRVDGGAIPSAWIRNIRSAGGIPQWTAIHLLSEVYQHYRPAICPRTGETVHQDHLMEIDYDDLLQRLGFTAKMISHSIDLLAQRKLITPSTRVFNVGGSFITRTYVDINLDALYDVTEPTIAGSQMETCCMATPCQGECEHAFLLRNSTGDLESTGTLRNSTDVLEMTISLRESTEVVEAPDTRVVGLNGGLQTNADTADTRVVELKNDLRENTDVALRACAPACEDLKTNILTNSTNMHDTCVKGSGESKGVEAEPVVWPKREVIRRQPPSARSDKRIAMVDGWNEDLFPLLKALVDACGATAVALGPLADDRNYGYAQEFAVAMHKAGYSVADVEWLSNMWYALDWRGQKLQKPSSAQLRTFAGEMMGYKGLTPGEVLAARKLAADSAVASVSKKPAPEPEEYVLGHDPYNLRGSIQK